MEEIMNKYLMLAALAALVACESAPRPTEGGGTVNVTVNAPAGVDGKDGIDGQNGKDGANGVDGKDGLNGYSCTTLADPADASCTLITCGDGSSSKVCNGANANIGPVPCMVASDCDDGNLCTVEGCSVGGFCYYYWLDSKSCQDCDDDDPDTFVGAPELCDGKDNDCDGLTDEGCPVPPACELQSDCDDGDACTIDSCVDATGVCSHANVDCDDGDPLTADSCDPATGCVHEPSTPPAHTGCYGLSFEVAQGTTCMGWPKTGPEQWIFTSTYAGWFSAPDGTCSVTCDSIPAHCAGEWDGWTSTMLDWTTVGCAHLVHEDGQVVDPGCTWDSQHCIYNL
jgi:hypothetical protein